MREKQSQKRSWNSCENRCINQCHSHIQMITKLAYWKKLVHNSVQCCLHHHHHRPPVMASDKQAKIKKKGGKKRTTPNAQRSIPTRSASHRNGRLVQFPPQALYNHISFRTIKIALQPRISLNPIPDLESCFPSARHLALLGSWHTRMYGRRGDGA